MLLLDFLLLAVIVVTAYLGPMVLRRLGPGQRMYGWMLVADLALALIALISRRNDGPNATADLVGTIAVGGGICLVFLPPLLRDLARRALVADRLAIARVLVNLREHLQPGMGARQEGELISTILEVRGGQVDTAIERLRARREQISEPAARRPVDERIIMTYLYARRWEEAAGWFELHIDPHSASPQLAVELVRAYCELGQLDAAARLVERLERAQGGEDQVWSLLVSRARLVFLAFAGRTAAVDAILGPRGPLATMPESARCFWYGLVRLKAGDRSGARSSLERSAALSGRDGRARALAESILSRIDEPGVAGPPEVSPLVAELADRLSRLAEDAPARPDSRAGKDPAAAHGETGGRARRAARRTRSPRLSGVSWREVPVTSGIIAANIAAAVLVYLVSGSTDDLGALIAAGANAKEATAAGEHWRLVSNTFLHAGLLHLALNMYGLWVLGRIVEQFIGSARMFAVYVGAAIAGSTASLLFGGPATSVGASGAVFGLLGAAVAELAMHRKAYPTRWSGPLLVNLVFLAAANAGIGLLYPVIDQSAHLGGLACGCALGAVLSRKLRVADTAAMRAVVVALVVAGAGALAYGAWGVATADFARTMARFPRVERTIGGLAVRAPAPWRLEDDQLIDEGLGVIVKLGRFAEPIGPGGVAAHVEQLVEIERTQGSKEAGLHGVHVAPTALLRVPPPWVIRELEADMEGGVGGEQTIRVAVVGRVDPVSGDLWIGSIEYAASLADALGPTMVDLLGSARKTSLTAPPE